ncbi:MAG: type II secretion system F family protein [Planctomycetaceae bacterium]
MSPLIGLMVFVGVTGMVALIAFALKDWGGTRVEDRLQVLAGLKAAEIESRGLLKEDVVKEGVEGVAGMINRVTSRLGNLRNLFVQADSPISVNTFLLISFGCAMLGVVIALAGNVPAPLYPVQALLFGSLPLAWLLLRRRARFKKFAKQLPDALELVGRALRSGHSLASGMHVVVQEMPSPIATEFAYVYESQNLGIPIEQSLKDMLRRMPNLDLKFFVTSVVIQRQTGGDLAEILDKISHIIRERFKILGQVQALTGEGRISGIVLMALPIALFFVVYYLNPDYVMLLFTDPLGRKMIASAAVLQVMGAIAIKKIVNIKV